MNDHEVESVKPVEAVPYKDFARRMEQACDGNPNVPPHNFGRLRWFVERLEEVGVKSTPENIRRWLAGLNFPRKKAMVALARILEVDEGWLSSGAQVLMDERELKTYTKAISGALNVVAGFIMMDGSAAAFPAESDLGDIENEINLHAIIRGVKHSFHVTVVTGEGDDQHFIVPRKAEGAIVLGVVPAGQFSVRVFELDWEMVKEIGGRRTGEYHVPLNAYEWREITSFAERI